MKIPLISRETLATLRVRLRKKRKTRNPASAHHHSIKPMTHNSYSYEDTMDIKQTQYAAGLKGVAETLVGFLVTLLLFDGEW